MLSKFDPVKLIEIIIICIFLCFSGTSAMAANQQVVIIANSSVPVDSLSHNGLREVFLGRETIWNNELMVKVVIQKESSAHTFFTRKLMHKSPDQFYRYWREQLYLGHSSLPASFNNEKDLIEYVARTPGAIGYVSTAPESNQIKKIRIED